jgi:hypothetical protein
MSPPLLGLPPGDYSGGSTCSTRSLKRDPPPGGSVAEWFTKDRDIGVYFDARGCVVGMDSDVAR